MEDSMHSTEALSIPVVTEEDLRSFHPRHFAQAPLPAQFFQTVNATEYEEDDDLGHYPDGVKRTLTGEQIAMFRHSEIEFLLREKRYREELEGSASPAQRDDPGSGPAPLPSSSSTNKGPQSAQSHGRSASARDPSRKRRNNKKRKREAETVPPHLYSEEEMINRRAARELDERKDVSVELDY